MVQLSELNNIHEHSAQQHHHHHHSNHPNNNHSNSDNHNNNNNHHSNNNNGPQSNIVHNNTNNANHGANNNKNNLTVSQPNNVSPTTLHRFNVNAANLLNVINERPQGANNRSHSICVMPNSNPTVTKIDTKDNNNEKEKDIISNIKLDPIPAFKMDHAYVNKMVDADVDGKAANKQQQPPPKIIVELGSIDSKSSKCSDSTCSGSITTGTSSQEDVNLNRHQVIKDKTEGLNHLDHSITQHLQHHQQQDGANYRHHHVNHPIIHPPVSILMNNNNTIPNSASYYELKHLQQGGAPKYALNGSPPINGKKLLFDTPPSPKRSRLDPNLDPIDGIVSLLSAIYCKILVVIGLCFPMAEVISHRIPISWYEGFYLYLYTMSIVFLIFVYIFLLNRKRKPTHTLKICSNFLNSKLRGNKNKSLGISKHHHHDSEHCDSDPEGHSRTASYGSETTLSSDEFNPTQQIQCGSFYLRVGAVAFGVGSMIYSGLEFGQFFELESKEHCYSFMYGLTPGSHMIFTFIQLYFIFMNSRVVIARHKLIARFGLMHMIGTNICVWLHVLIQETKHQIMTMVNTNNTELGIVDMTHAWDHVDDVVEEISEDYLDSVSSHPVPHRPGGHVLSNIIAAVNSTIVSTTTTTQASAHGGNSHGSVPGLHRAVRSLNDHYITHSDCRRSNIIGELVTDASQFLFPCTIEYSLICAAILYIMWKSISEMKIKSTAKMNQMNNNNSNPLVHHQKHHYQVDCAKAHKGLFTGIFLMVICIISLILFFVFIKKDQYRNLAVLQAHIVELFIYCICAIACLIALFQVRELHYNRSRGVELDNILLIIAQSGLCIFTMFSIIGAQFISQLQNTRLVLINALACLIQSTLQSVFILDASKRKASTADQVRRKPGREMVTFLLVCNFSMWAINTLETRRAESNPVQMSFYGFWAWTIITHVTMPLTIFYRFHSTVCLCEIWKGTYKIKSEYI